MPPPFRPTPAQVAAAHGRGLPDVLSPGLAILFCGINPGLYSAAIGHHFGRPGNRFWPALHRAGFTPRQFSPCEDRLLLPLGYGLTNFVARATAGAAELDPAELRAGAVRLTRKLRRYRPRCIAVTGLGAYRVARACLKAQLGRQPDLWAGAVVWVLPNPSGLNAHFPVAELARRFRELREAVEGFQRAEPQMNTDEHRWRNPDS